VNLRFVFLLIFLSLPLLSSSQERVTHQWLYWVRYYNVTQVNDKLALHTEIDNRRYFNPSRQSQFFTHIHLHYRVKPWLDVAAGFNFNLTKLPATSLSVPELRPWQELNVSCDAKNKWQFLFRYRIDERFIHKNNGVELTDGYHFNLRHRFRVMATTTLTTFKNKNRLMLKLYNEVMLNTGDVPQAFDQNRLSGSLEYQFNKRWSLETGYINILQPKADSEYYDRNVIRTTLHHRMGSRN
jgi:hypothetical protein